MSPPLLKPKLHPCYYFSLCVCVWCVSTHVCACLPDCVSVCVRAPTHPCVYLSACVHVCLCVWREQLLQVN